jgi:hypothetical protein
MKASIQVIQCGVLIAGAGLTLALVSAVANIPLLPTLGGVVLIPGLVVALIGLIMLLVEATRQDGPRSIP